MARGRQGKTAGWASTSNVALPAEPAHLEPRPSPSSPSLRMSHNQPLLSSQIEPDSNSPPSSPFPSGNIGGGGAPRPAAPATSGGSGLPTPVTQANGNQAGQDDGVVAMLKRSSHPVRPLTRAEIVGFVGGRSGCKMGSNRRCVCASRPASRSVWPSARQLVLNPLGRRACR